MNIKLTIHPLFIVFAVILCYLGYFSVLLFYVLTLVLHESAHALVAQKLGYKLNHITLMPYGAAISGRDCFFSKSDEIKVALAGPILNIVLSILGCAIWWLEPASYVYTREFIYANWAVGITNLLPIFPLDGGRVILALLCKKTSVGLALTRVRTIGIVVASLLVIGFFITTLFVPNYTMLVFGGFVFLSSIIQDKSSYYSSIDYLSKHAKLIGGLKIKEVAVPCSIPLYKLFSCLTQDSLTSFCMVDESLNEVARFGEKELVEWLKLYPASTTLDTIITK